MIEFLVIGLSSVIAFVLLKSRYNYQSLDQLKLAEHAEPLNLTVVIPARNEAHQIARAVESFPGLPVIVIDDDSSDDTGCCRS